MTSVWGNIWFFWSLSGGISVGQRGEFSQLGYTYTASDFCGEFFSISRDITATVSHKKKSFRNLPNGLITFPSLRLIVSVFFLFPFNLFQSVCVPVCFSFSHMDKLEGSHFFTVFTHWRIGESHRGWGGGNVFLFVLTFRTCKYVEFQRNILKTSNRWVAELGAL